MQAAWRRTLTYAWAPNAILDILKGSLRCRSNTDNGPFCQSSLNWTQWDSNSQPKDDPYAISLNHDNVQIHYPKDKTHFSRHLRCTWGFGGPILLNPRVLMRSTLSRHHDCPLWYSVVCATVVAHCIYTWYLYMHAAKFNFFAILKHIIIIIKKL